MKRLPQSEYLKRINWDTNKESLYKAGQIAREKGQPLTSCPRLESYAGLRAAELAKAWRTGWIERDAQLDKWLPYKEES